MLTTETNAGIRLVQYTSSIVDPQFRRLRTEFSKRMHAASKSTASFLSKLMAPNPQIQRSSSANCSQSGHRALYRHMVEAKVTQLSTCFGPDAHASSFAQVFAQAWLCEPQPCKSPRLRSGSRASLENLPQRFGQEPRNFLLVVLQEGDHLLPGGRCRTALPRKGLVLALPFSLHAPVLTLGTRVHGPDACLNRSCGRYAWTLGNALSLPSRLGSRLRGSFALAGRFGACCCLPWSLPL